MIEEWEDRMWENPEMFKDAESFYWTDLAKNRYVFGGQETILGLVDELNFSQNSRLNAINLATNMWRLGFKKYKKSFDTELIWLQLLEYKRSLDQHHTVVDQRRGI